VTEVDLPLGARPDPPSAASAVLLAGAVLMALWAFAIVPRGPRPTPSTPFDRSNRPLADAFRFLSAARPLLPAGASVAVIAEPRDAGRETSLYGAAVGALPAQHVLPAAQWGAFTPNHELEAEYEIVYGPAPTPAAAPGVLVASIPGGSIYRRARP
jgi:hypothetical protein